MQMRGYVRTDWMRILIFALFAIIFFSILRTLAWPVYGAAITSIMLAAFTNFVMTFFVTDGDSHMERSP
jgi:hypothetical protein